MDPLGLADVKYIVATKDRGVRCYSCKDCYSYNHRHTQSRERLGSINFAFAGSLGIYIYMSVEPYRRFSGYVAVKPRFNISLSIFLG